MEIKPDESYPRRRLNQIKEKLRAFNKADNSKESAKEQVEEDQQQEQVDQEGRDLPAMDFDDNREKKKYLNKLAEEYPEGITVEHYDFENREVKRVIVNYEGLAKEYRKVMHSWGGTYYFRNGQSVSEAVFNVETKER